MEDLSQLKPVLRFYQLRDGSFVNHLNAEVEQRLGCRLILEYSPIGKKWLALDTNTNCFVSFQKITKEMELAVALLGD